MKRITRFSSLNNMILSFNGYKGVIGVGDLGRQTGERDRKEENEDIRFPESLLILYGMEGSAKIQLDYTPYEIKPDSVIIVLPIHVLQIVETSNDFKGKFLVVQKSFVEECNCANSYFSVSNYMTLRKNPFVSFTPGQAISLGKCLDDIEEKVKLKSHIFYKDVIKVAFCAFALELAHLINEQKVIKKLPALSRKEELVNKFFQLIMSYCKVEHTTTFYAEKLCITPQYLSAILKDMTGKPANQWIADALMTEAKIQLRKPQVTVQEVAYTLNFSDQSSFGKFFKKGIGISPSQYRVGAVG